VLWEQLVNGISLGMSYALIAIGYSIVFSVLKMMNFAHGDVFTFGTFASLFFLQTLHLPVIVSVILAMAVGAILAAIVEFVAYRPLRQEEFIFSMITVLGAGYIIRNAAELIWGNRMRPFPSILPSQKIHLGSATVSAGNIAVIVISVLVLVGVFLFLRFSRHGRAVNCMAQDTSTASLMGIRINLMASLLYGVGGALGVIGGILFSSIYNVIHVSMAFSGTMVAYTASIVGGYGSLGGAALGGLIIGVSQQLFSAYVSSAYKDVITYVILIIVLLVRPNGLLGKRQLVEKV
jgi:branched-chain amino acid transport system permease protein